MKLNPILPEDAWVRLHFWRLSGASFCDVPLRQALDTRRWLWSTGAVVWHTQRL